MVQLKVVVDDFTVGWICALPVELEASSYMFDQEYDAECRQVLRKHKEDHNSYRIGKIGGHSVAMACLPAGLMGKVSAAACASQMKSTFPNLKFGLMVGIGGGIPTDGGPEDIRLGDVFVSRPVPEKKCGGVIQYDFGKEEIDGFHITGRLNAPPKVLLNALSHLQSSPDSTDELLTSVIKPRLEQSTRKQSKKFQFPVEKPDVFIDYRCFNDQHNSRTKEACSSCGGTGRQVKRPDRGDYGDNPRIHYGIIASGDKVVKNAVERDRIAKKTGARCVEMEAAGLMEDFPSLVIRGICDYADSKKHKEWQPYAAITAAAYARVLLKEFISPATVEGHMESIGAGNRNAKSARKYRPNKANKNGDNRYPRQQHSTASLRSAHESQARALSPDAGIQASPLRNSSSFADLRNMQSYPDQQVGRNSGHYPQKFGRPGAFPQNPDHHGQYALQPQQTGKRNFYKMPSNYNPSSPQLRLPSFEFELTNEASTRYTSQPQHPSGVPGRDGDTTPISRSEYEVRHGIPTPPYSPPPPTQQAQGQLSPLAATQKPEPPLDPKNIIRDIACDNCEEPINYPKLRHKCITCTSYNQCHDCYVKRIPCPDLDPKSQTSHTFVDIKYTQYNTDTSQLCSGCTVQIEDELRYECVVPACKNNYCINCIRIASSDYLHAPSHKFVCNAISEPTWAGGERSAEYTKQRKAKSGSGGSGGSGSDSGFSQTSATSKGWFGGGFFGR